jgi:hypothetical protein
VSDGRSVGRRSRGRDTGDAVCRAGGLPADVNKVSASLGSPHSIPASGGSSSVPQIAAIARA